MTRDRTTALLVVDAQNGFLHPDGENYWPGAEQVVEPLMGLIEQARRTDHLIVHIADRHRPGLADAEFAYLPEHSVDGSFDAEFYDGFGPQKPGGRELVIVKRRYSGFFATDLAIVLREHGVTDTVIAGVKTNVCVRATATDAFAHGFVVTVPQEATATNRPALGDASLEDIDRYIGSTVPIEVARGLLR